MLDKEVNRIGDPVRRVHLMAACGTGMAALACLLKELGCSVSGSDQNVYPPMCDLLAQSGIPVAAGFSGDNLDHDPDLVVVGNAVSKHNPEAVALAEKKLPYCSLPQAVNHFVAGRKAVLMISGTHGKTTTASLLAWMLHTAGLDPSFMIGGVLRDFGGNYRLGEGPYIVIEGDEYDTAFFDKGSKFLHYRPDSLVVTGVEFDHADIFADLSAVNRSFAALFDGLPADSRLFAYDGDNNLSDLIFRHRPDAVRYGEKKDSAWHLEETEMVSAQTRFKVRKNSRRF